MDILFLCTGNSCRSQMAEGFAKTLAPHDVHIWSAGIEAHGLHPRAVSAMKEVGIDISTQTSKTIVEIPLDKIDKVITLCGHADKTCPQLPSSVEKEHWPLHDPAKANGTEEVISSLFRDVREDIRNRIGSLFKIDSTTP